MSITSLAGLVSASLAKNSRFGKIFLGKTASHFFIDETGWKVISTYAHVLAKKVANR